MTRTITVRDGAALVAAVASGAMRIEVHGTIKGLPPLLLHPGQTLCGHDSGAILVFEGDGIVLAGDNSLDRLTLKSPADNRAIRVDDKASACGQIALRDLTCEGLVQLILFDQAGDVDFLLSRISVAQADATGQLPRPFGNGVEVQQGALTLWNRSATGTVVTVDAEGLAIGHADAPVGGTGLFVAGHGDADAGKLLLRRFITDSVYSDSRLAAGTTQTVAGGIFFLGGVEGRDVLTRGEIVTHGANAVPVDSWGKLGCWRIEGDARSHGPSAVGFVNAGQLDRCEIMGMLETHGDGARGCCIYGPTGQFVAGSIRTHGRAAAGVQVVDRLDRLEVHDGIFTQGDAGEGLMKGKMIQTPAHGVEIEQGGWLGELDCATIAVTGSEAKAIHVEGVLERIIRP